MTFEICVEAYREVGSVQEMIDKLMRFQELFGLDRAIVNMGFGGAPQKDLLNAVELLGAEVAAVVRREVASRGGAAT